MTAAKANNEDGKCRVCPREIVLCAGVRCIGKTGPGSRHTLELYTGGQRKSVGELRDKTVHFNLAERKLQGDMRAIFEYLKCDCGRFCSHGPTIIHPLHRPPFFPGNQTDLFRLPQRPLDLRKKRPQPDPGSRSMVGLNRP